MKRRGNAAAPGGKRMSDDKFHLEYREDGVYLSASEGADYSTPSVVGFLKSRGVENYNGDAVMTFLSRKDGSSAKVAERDPEQEKEASFEVKIAPDAMSAELWIEPPFADKPWPTVDQVVEFLAAQGVVEGVDRGLIADILSENRGRTWSVVASGIPAIDGADADFDYKVQFGAAKPKEEDESGRVDLKNLSSVTVVMKNQMLAEKIPATEGVDGTTVKGTVLKAKKGKDRPLPAGAGTYASEDGAHLLALIDGNLVLKGGKLHVAPVFQVDGDVDYSVGNINFIGDVLVNGAVREGFEIVSSGDIEIRGVVEGSHLSSTGNISITGGIRGMNKAKIEADGNITVGFIDQAHVRSSKDIMVNNAVLHSDLAAHGNVTVLGGQKSQIAGGKVQAGMEVSCLTLGSEMGTKTEIIVGVLAELTERKKHLLGILAEAEEKSEKIEANLSFLKKLEAAGQLDENKRALMISLTKAKFQLQSQLGTAREELRLLEEQMENSKTKGCVRVKGNCYPGVTVTVRGLTYIVREKQQFCAFVYDGGEVKVKPFDY